MLDSLTYFFALLKIGIKLRKRFVVVRSSRIVLNVLHLLYKEGFISGFAFSPVNCFELIVFLKYVNGVSLIKDCSIVSKSGQRVFFRKGIKHSFLYKGGVFLVSSSTRGVFLTDSCVDCGGEVLAKILL
jgi:ribosomal protein S8